jgi:hypothetical protein
MCTQVLSSFWASHLTFADQATSLKPSYIKSQIPKSWNKKQKCPHYFDPLFTHFFSKESFSI